MGALMWRWCLALWRIIRFVPALLLSLGTAALIRIDRLTGFQPKPPTAQQPSAQHPLSLPLPPGSVMTAVASPKPPKVPKPAAPQQISPHVLHAPIAASVTSTAALPKVLSPPVPAITRAYEVPAPSKPADSVRPLLVLCDKSSRCALTTLSRVHGLCCAAVLCCEQ
jgi:hypothetical protein